MQKTIAIVFLCFHFLTAGTSEGEASQSMRIAVMPFTGQGVDADLLLEVEERAKRLIAGEDSFELISVAATDETAHNSQGTFLNREETELLWEKLGATMIFEGALERTRQDRINISIRVAARSSTWRPPVVLSATASTSEYAIPQTETLVRQFLNRYFDEQSMELFFQSAFIPGLGQYREGYKSKGAIFFFGTTGLVLGSFLLPGGNQYEGQGSVEFRPDASGLHRWFVGSTPVSPEEAEAEMDRRAEAENSRAEARRTKLVVLGAGVALYVVNLYDILKITKRYDKVPNRRFSFQLNPLTPDRMVTLTCNFDISEILRIPK